ncbi:aromatic motif membrane protein [Mycoplasma sp. CSL10166]|uniref:aromatic motif membrane protein n=1 Tax=Mycoplasma sp. CSL10166 TaxID=2813825 RepID=UPI00197B198D|nr:aromatic motif membrane protein [Mycoplasma sp. CSL10166]MBN4084317.1 hypothetical protein [Mycoplasma sp. CSL10166]
MKKIKKWFIFSPILALVPTIAVSWQKTQNISNETKMSQIVTKEIKEDKWDIFLKYEYVNSLLNLAFKTEKSKKAYIKKQREISDNYLTEIKDYLLYGNNVVAMYRSDDSFFSSKKVIGLKDYRAKLSELFSRNWLWFLFNLDRFTFALYDAFDQFQGTLEALSQDIQKSSLETSAFNRPTTNEVLQYVIEENVMDENLEYDAYLLTKQGIILKISFSTQVKDGDQEIPKNKQKTDVAIFTYSYIYPSLFQNQVALQNFDLARYARSEKLASTFGSKRWVKILFDEQNGGTPLRFTIVYVDDKK